MTSLRAAILIEDLLFFGESLFHRMYRSSPVVRDGASMADPEYANPLRFVLDGADEAVVTDSIPPQPSLFAAQILPEPVRVFLAREAFSQIAENSPLDLFVETGKL